MTGRPPSDDGPDRREFLVRGAGLAAGAGLGGGLLGGGLLGGGLLGGGLLGWPRRAPAAVTREADRPKQPQGVQSGDVSPVGAVVWGRADRPATMRVEWSTDPTFARGVEAIDGPDVLADRDLTGRVGLRGLPAGAEVHYRVSFRCLRTGAWSAPTPGRLRTPAVRLEGAALERPLTFAWGGDTCGQGFGINPDLGGMVIHDRIRETEPDLFIHCGDLIYADAPIHETKRLDDGRIWRNRVVPEKAKVAETLAEFRANFRYNLLDAPFRRLLAAAPMVVQWDDHETKNNWWPGRILRDGRYTEKSCDLLAARAKRAFFDYTPIAHRADRPGRIYRALPQGPLLELFVLDARTYRGPNGPNRQRVPGPKAAFFGDLQLDWLCRRLERSTATWKLIASDQPLSLHISHAGTESEGMANSYGGPPSGRELELARLLTHIRRRNIRNVVFVTADVHYAAAHRYDPKSAAFREFDPFWEFVAGPLNAGTFGPNPLDPTFGPREAFVGIPRDLQPNRSPLDGFQFFGTGAVDPRSRGLTMRLHDMKGAEIHRVELEPR